MLFIISSEFQSIVFFLNMVTYTFVEMEKKFILFMTTDNRNFGNSFPLKNLLYVLNKTQCF